MNEKNENENNKKRTRINGERKFYLLTAIGSALALVAIVVIAIVVSNAVKTDTPAANLHSSISSTQGGTSADKNNPDNSAPDVNGSADNPNQDEPVGTLPKGMVAPVASAAVLNDYGFYHNKTLNIYYEHEGLDFTAAAGTEVLAAESGVIESIYKEDVLLGTEIVVDHGNGLKTVYRFVTEAEGLKVGDEVEKGEVIATIAEANGNEYKDGAHLHFEVLQDGKHVDPALHLPLEEK